MRRAVTTATEHPSKPVQVDPRGMRFAASLTAIVLAAVLLTQSGRLLAAQGMVFAIGAFADTVGLVATGSALAAAFLNAAFGLCLGCELYLVSARTLHPIFPDRFRGRATTNTRSPITEVSA